MQDHEFPSTPLANPSTPPTPTPVTASAMPRARHRGVITLANDRKIECYVLDDHRRVLSLRQLAQLFGYKGNRARERDGLQWPRFLMQDAIWPRLEQRFTLAPNLPFEFILQPNGDVPERVALAFQAELLLDLCDAWIDAALDGETRTTHEPMVDAARRMTRGFKRIGLTALIDEATGYQEQREPGDLQALLLRMITQEDPADWERSFDVDFFIELYRIYEIPGDPLAHRRPGCVAGKINFVVYERLSPNLLPYLETVNPSDGEGQRPQKHHQYLTRLGRMALRHHLRGVMRLMRRSQSRVEFDELLALVYPCEHEQLSLGIRLALFDLAGDDPDPDV
jgi:hypothetical protein